MRKFVGVLGIGVIEWIFFFFSFRWPRDGTAGYTVNVF